MQGEVFGAKGKNETPKARTVIHLLEVTEFVNHDGPHEGFAFGDDPPVIGDPAGGKRAAPERVYAPPNHAPLRRPEICLRHGPLVNGADIGLEVLPKKPPVSLLDFGFRSVGGGAQMKNPVLHVRGPRPEPHGILPPAPAKRSLFTPLPA